MVLEKTSESLVKRHLILFSRWEIPLTLEALGLDAGQEYFENGIERMLGENSPIHNLLVPVSKEEARSAILKADTLGRQFLPLS